MTKHYKLTYVLFFLFYFSIFLKAQTPPSSTFEAATIFYLNGTQEEGLVSRTDFKKLGEEVYFKSNMDSEPIKHTIYTIDGFKFTSDDTQFKKVKFRLIDFDEKGGEVKIDRQRFAKILVKSSINLYKVELKRNDYNSEIIGSADYLYIINNAKDTLQLDVLTGERNGSALMANERYKGKLKYLFLACPSLNVSNTSFRDNSIISSIKKYNDCIGNEEDMEVASTDRKTIVEHRINLFASAADFRFEDHSYYGLGYTTTIFSPEVSNSLGATIGAGLTYQKYVSKTFRKDISQLHLKIDFLLDWRIMNRLDQHLSIQTGLSWYPHLGTNPKNLTNTPFNVFSYAILPVNLMYDYKKFRFFIGLSRTVDVGIGYQFN